jgi:hypothetical protein
MFKATVVVTIACLGVSSVGGVTGHAQVPRGSKVVVAPEASVESVSFMQNVVAGGIVGAKFLFELICPVAARRALERFDR